MACLPLSIDTRTLHVQLHAAAVRAQRVTSVLLLSCKGPAMAESQHTSVIRAQFRSCYRIQAVLATYLYDTAMLYLSPRRKAAVRYRHRLLRPCARSAAPAGPGGRACWPRASAARQSSSSSRRCSRLRSCATAVSQPASCCSRACAIFLRRAHQMSARQPHACAAALNSETAGCCPALRASS